MRRGNAPERTRQRADLVHVPSERLPLRVARGGRPASRDPGEKGPARFKLSLEERGLHLALGVVRLVPFELERAGEHDVRARREAALRVETRARRQRGVRGGARNLDEQLLRDGISEDGTNQQSIQVGVGYARGGDDVPQPARLALGADARREVGGDRRRERGRQPQRERDQLRL
eukprot:4042057-Pleurochrysis_carterae.AAC.1